MSIDPINPDDTEPVDPPAEEPDTVDEPEEPAPFVPQVGEVVRLDDPAADGEPRFALYLDESTVLPLTGVQRYELPLYPVSG